MFLHFPILMLTELALCIAHKLEKYYCTSVFYDSKQTDTLKDFTSKKNIHYTFPEVCKKCNVLPLCLCSCKILDPEKNACISEKYIIIDLLKHYLDNPDLWDA